MIFPAGLASKIGKIALYLVIMIFVLAVLQDYVYSKLQSTGFYIAESLIYNIFWLFFIPLTMLLKQLIKKINPQKRWRKISFNIGVGIVFPLLHILLFASFFVLISNLLFSPAHRFARIFNSALSNQLYLTVLWYAICPIIYASKSKPSNLSTSYLEKIKLKVGSKIITISISSIQLISTDKPYAILYTKDQKFLDNKSLKEFETTLDPSIFLRVHRSAIINATFIEELKSRNNGDYDAKLENGQVIRLSRHYRNNWQQLLQ